ncbi:MAG: hypothetical protein ACRDHD_06460 [Candidatus Limnocylindria bacterium]
MRTLGWILVGYAAIGMVFVSGGLLAGGPLVARVDRLTTSASATLESATLAAGSAADAFTGFDASLGDARASARDAASLSREASVTLDGLAQAMSISILGSRPLEPLGGRFETSADQLRLMGDNLESIGEALIASRDDVARVGLRLRDLAERLTALQGRVASERSLAGLPLSWLFYGFLLWQLLPIAAAALAGIAMIRRPEALPVSIP